MINESICCINNDFSVDNLKRLITEIYGYTAPLCYLHSFGCQQNVTDGEKLKGLIKEIGYGFTDNEQDASLIILNTCAVRENAEDRVFGTIGEYKHIKKKRPDAVVCICGCMAQQKHIAERIKQKYKQIDLVFGTFAFNQFYEMLYEVLKDRKRVFNITERKSEINENFKQLRDDKIKASVPIMYGCNNFCTYCIVPYVRGRECSRSVDAVYDEVYDLVRSGYKEITLLGQNVNSYGYGFPNLLRKLNSIDGDFRIRFMSSHPKDATHELIDTILECDKVCKHLHLPMQSGCDRILHEMNRRYTLEEYARIINYARDKKPDFSFTSDIIVGFPGETYEEFCQTKEAVKRFKFDNIYSFVYSKRSGTKAALMEDNISDKQKGLWLRELLLEHREVTVSWLSRFIGKTVQVLADGEGRTSEKHLQGRSNENIIVEFVGDKSLIGEFVNVKITKTMNWAMLGEIVK